MGATAPVVRGSVNGLAGAVVIVFFFAILFAYALVAPVKVTTAAGAAA